MKTIIKILISIVIIAILVFIAENLLIKKANIEVSNKPVVLEQINETTDKNDEEYDVLVIGNSLTIERDGIGMAASDEYHDYYYLLNKKLEKIHSKVNMSRISAIHWEENRIISSRTDWINQNLTEEKLKNKDLVIFQLGDNCVPTESFEVDVTELVNHVKKYSPDAKMLLVGMWFINEERLAMMPNIANNLNMEFVNISDLVVDENKSYIGQEITGIDGKKDTISTIEEAFHPNDSGMEKIAERIMEKIE